LSKVKTAAAEVKAGNMEEAVKTIVAEAIVLPTATSQTGSAAGGEGTPVPIPSAENPATDFLKSRFGSFAELANPLSNFF
jgi:ribosomal protein L12E/L44/L45/RPP1/RPP2